MEKKFLICGFGNVAQRHFRNLKTILPDCEITVYTSAKETYRVFNNELNISYTNDLKKVYNINTVYYDIDIALGAEKYDAVFICSLPPPRIDIAIKVANKGFNLFIEKPLSNNLDKVYKLRDIVEEKKLNCVIGFQMRFHPIVQKIKDSVDNKEFGDIYRIEVNHCNNIFNFTQGRDLKDFYALKKETGGGVVLSQLHEIDYLTYLFGIHCPISSVYGSRLGYAVEDNITILSTFEKNNYNIPIIINLDFLSQIPRREITIYGMNKIQTFNLMSTDSVEWNKLFFKEITAFINLLTGYKDVRLANLEDGIHSLEYASDIRIIQ